MECLVTSISCSIYAHLRCSCNRQGPGARDAHGLLRLLVGLPHPRGPLLALTANRTVVTLGDGFPGQGMRPTSNLVLHSPVLSEVLLLKIMNCIISKAFFKKEHSKKRFF